MIPDYLKEPSLSGHIFGKLEYDDEEDVFVLTGEPLVLQYAKRIFPGARVTRGGGGSLQFHRTRREVSDLNWLLMRFPLNVEQCKPILDRAREDAIYQIKSRMSGSDKTRVKPPSEFLGKLHPYQEVGTNFLVTNKRCLLADQMGLGKSWTSLAAAATAGDYPVLIVCQTHIQIQWQRMIGMLFDFGGQAIPEGTNPFRLAKMRGEKMAPILRSQTPYQIPNTPFAIIHYGLLQYWKKHILDRRFKTIIFDEVQELRHTGTAKYSSASELSSVAENVYSLSGTPIYGYGAEIWSVMNAIDFHCLGSYEAFTREWCTGYGEKIVSDPQALNGHLSREGLMLRRKSNDQDVAIDLPNISRQVQDLNHDEVLYDKLIGTARESAKKYDASSFTARGRIARLVDSQSRQATGVAKAEYVAEFVESLIEAGERPLLYGWHHAVHDIYLKRLGKYNPVVFTGKQTSKQKEKNLERYSEGDTPLALLSLRSAAGLDGLQHHANMCVFGELDWSPAVFSQCETRIARIGVDKTLEDVPSYYCVASVGHDEIMMDVLGVKTGQFVGIVGDEPESYEEQQEAERRAAQRISMLIKKLKNESKEELPAPPKEDRIEKQRLVDDSVNTDRNKLINAFGGKLGDG